MHLHTQTVWVFRNSMLLIFERVPKYFYKYTSIWRWFVRQFMLLPFFFGEGGRELPKIKVLKEKNWGGGKKKKHCSLCCLVIRFFFFFFYCRTTKCIFELSSCLHKKGCNRDLHWPGLANEDKISNVPGR